MDLEPRADLLTSKVAWLPQALHSSASNTGQKLRIIEPRAVERSRLMQLREHSHGTDVDANGRKLCTEVVFIQTSYDVCSDCASRSKRAPRHEQR